jgi:DNA-directed RNA polymerase specialized sigma24 family protein
MVPDTEISSDTAVFVKLYETAFPGVARFVKKMGGGIDDARDIFQDSLVIYYENQRSGKNIFTNEAAYISGIARHLWYKKFKTEIKKSDLDPELYRLVNEEDLKVSSSLLEYLEATGKKCMELLKSFYYDGLPMKEIAVNFKFSGERSATAQKFKCLEKVREAVKKQSLQKTDFYE